MVLAVLLFYAGAVMFVLMAAAALVWQPLPRRQMLRAAAAGGGLLLCLAAFYVIWGWLEGSLAAWPSCLAMEITDKYFAAEPRVWPGLLFLGYFVLGSGGAPVLGLVEVFWKSRPVARDQGPEMTTGTGAARSCASLRRIQYYLRCLSPFSSPVPSTQCPVLGEPTATDHSPSSLSPWRRTVATVTFAYLAIILGCGLKNLHYLGPLMPLGLILWLGGGRRPALRSVVACGSLAVCIVLCWPHERPIFTLNRQLGEKTLFRADSYEEACRWARMADELYRAKVLSWQISPHTWVGYAERGRGAGVGNRGEGRGKADSRANRPLVVSDVEIPLAEYRLLFASPEGAKLYCCDPEVRAWLAAQRPLTGPRRLPWVFQPIAIQPDPRFHFPPSQPTVPATTFPASSAAGSEVRSTQ
jgi:hypothetical protein